MKRVEIVFGTERKAFKFSSISGLEDQLRLSFRIGSISKIELLASDDDAVVPLQDLEEGGVYVVRKLHSVDSDWTCRPVWQTKDPIHGLIHLPDVCLRVIDTPEFQRLRDLKQTGSCHLVYIGATHTRFDHSIGVAWLGFKMVSSIAERQPELGITSQDILCVTLAALCHDLGHGAGSHMWDSAVLKRLGVEMSHEEMSLEIFDYIVEKIKQDWKKKQIFSSDDPFDNLGEEDFQFIKAMIHPGDDDRRIGRNSNKRFLMDIVSNKSNGIDIDRCDYIQRDTYNAGVRGIFDIDRLIQNVVIKEVDGLLTMCWPQKEMEGIIEIFHTRDSLHRRVYQHRTNVGIESMFRDAILTASPCIQIRNDKGEWLSFKDAQTDVSCFLHISDWIFHLLLHGQDLKIDWTDPRVVQARELLNDIQHRKIWKFVGTIVGQIDNQLKTRQELERCSGGFIPAELWELRTATFSWGYGDKNPLENVPFIQKNTDEPIKPKPEDLSRVFIPAAFREHCLYVYVKSQDPEIRELAQTAFSEWCTARGIESSLVDMSSVALSKRSRKRHAHDNGFATPARRVSPRNKKLQRTPSGGGVKTHSSNK